MRTITLETKIRIILLYVNCIKSAKEICSLHDLPTRTFRRWVSTYKTKGTAGLQSKRPGPPKGTHSISPKIQQRIIRLKQRHPSWGARRIKYQYDLPCHWRTVHNIIKHNGMLGRIKPKPQPSKRFQRRNVDSMWQGDTSQFRISETAKVYVTGFTDDRSRYRVISTAYLHKSRDEAIDSLRHVLKKGRIPKQIYLDTQDSSRQKNSEKSLPNTTSGQSMAGHTIQEEETR